jgi:hypothetical protein
VAVIDGKGRLFGKVNLLDLVVVLAVVAVVARFGYQKVAAKAVAPASQDKTVQVTFLLGMVQQFTADEMKEGDLVYDSKSGSLLGKVTATRKEPANVVRMGPDGHFWQNQSTTHFDCYVTVEGPARTTDKGTTMHGIEVKVGRAIDLTTARWAGAGVPVILPPR